MDTCKKNGQDCRDANDYVAVNEEGRLRRLLQRDMKLKTRF